MPTDDEFLDELQGSTGLSLEQLVEVIQESDPGYHQELVRRQQAQAKEKARALLLSHLTDMQRDQLESRGYFDVTSSAGRRFRLRIGRESNVQLMGVGDTAVCTFCIHVRDRVPDEDNVLGQMLALQHDEAAFLAVAGVR